jgi:hypothetical protein
MTYDPNAKRQQRLKRMILLVIVAMIALAAWAWWIPNGVFDPTIRLAQAWIAHYWPKG